MKRQGRITGNAILERTGYSGPLPHPWELQAPAILIPNLWRSRVLTSFSDFSLHAPILENRKLTPTQNLAHLPNILTGPPFSGLKWIEVVAVVWELQYTTDQRLTDHLLLFFFYSRDSHSHPDF